MLLCLLLGAVLGALNGLFVTVFGLPSLAVTIGTVATAVFVVLNPEQSEFYWFLVAISGVLGVTLTLSIGGADMPVVVSMLNSYSGWAAAAIGFSLGNDLLIVVGALVGSSGAILSYIMCKAMNRSFVSVILGGFGGPAGEQMAVEGEQIAIDSDGVATALNEADSVVIIPGYGMAVAQAQSSVAELVRKLRAQGVVCARFQCNDDGAA